MPLAHVAKHCQQPRSENPLSRRTQAATKMNHNGNCSAKDLRTLSASNCGNLCSGGLILSRVPRPSPYTAQSATHMPYLLADASGAAKRFLGHSPECPKCPNRAQRIYQDLRCRPAAQAAMRPCKTRCARYNAATRALPASGDFPYLRKYTLDNATANCRACPIGSTCPKSSALCCKTVTVRSLSM